MNAYFESCRARWLLGALLLTGALGAEAQFDSLERFGSLRVDGNLEFQDYDFSRFKSSSDGLGFHLAGTGALGYTLALPALALSTSSVEANGAANVVQTTTFDDRVLSYSSQARADMTGNAAAGSLYGQVVASSAFQATFGIAEASIANLQMDHLVDASLGVFSFSLIRNDGTVIWDRTALPAGGGASQNAFATTFALAPGFYQLSATLRAFGGLDPNTTVSESNARASFQLAVSASPVPEPSGVLMLCAGIMACALMRRISPFRGR